MPPALWLLMRLRFAGWLRRIGRNLRTVKGILLTAFGALVIGGWLFSVLITYVLGINQPKITDPAVVERWGTGILFAYTLMYLIFSATGDQAVAFTPAEVCFLFAGPFHRRHLLAYKLTVLTLNSLLGAVILTLVLLPYAGTPLAAFVAVFLTVLFLQFLATVVALLSGWLGEAASTRGRRVALAALVLVAGWAALQERARLAAAGWEGLVTALENAPVLAALTTPLRWFARAFAARHVWPDLAQWGAAAAAVDAALVVVIFRLDATYLETAAAASERQAARLQRMRSGGAGAHLAAQAGRPRFTLPSFPWLGGAGPIAWRQLLTSLRGLKALTLVLGVVSVFFLAPLVLGTQEAGEGEPRLAHLAGPMIAMLIFFLPTLLTFDFRSDYDRLDQLKALPLAPRQVVLGELLAPVVTASLIQLVPAAILAAAVGGADGGTILGLTVAFVLPANFLLFAVENLVFLLYPIRLTPAGPGDLQHVGRTMIFFWFKLACLMAAIGALAAVGAAAYFLNGESWPLTWLAVWVTLAILDACFVPLLAVAFRRFDVARDAPA